MHIGKERNKRQMIEIIVCESGCLDGGYLVWYGVVDEFEFEFDFELVEHFWFLSTGHSYVYCIIWACSARLD
jgi:hypothetical protein